MDEEVPLDQLFRRIKEMVGNDRDRQFRSRLISMTP